MSDLRDFRCLIKSRRHDDIACLDRLAAVDGDDIVTPVVALHARNPRAGTERQAARQTVQMRNNFLLRHEAIGIVFAIAHPGNARLPARRIQGEGIPAIIAPGVARPAGLFQHYVLDRVLHQVVADRKSGLSTAHDNSVLACSHRSSPRSRSGDRSARQSLLMDAEVMSAGRCHKATVQYMIVHETL